MKKYLCFGKLCGDFTWHDIENLDNTRIPELSQNFHIHELQLDECLSDKQFIQIEVEPDYIFLLLHFPYYQDSKDKVLTDRVGIFLGRNYLLTIHPGTTAVIKDIFEKFELAYANKPQTSGYMLYYLIAELLKYMASLTLEIQSEIDAIEDKVFNNTKSDAQQIGQLRQKIVRLLRITSLQNPILNELEAQINKFSNQDLNRLYKQNVKMGHKLYGNIEEAKETIEIYKDADFITSTEKTNEILAILTIIFTFSIPATVFGALYGMNVRLPGGLVTGSWEFFGTYTTFILIIIASLIPPAIMFWYFKKKHWL